MRTGAPVRTQGPGEPVTLHDRSRPGRRASDGTGTAWKPASATLAGFVPCAESGIRTVVRALPCSAWKARMTSSPVISPQAPAGGCSVARAMPVISHMACSSLHRSSRAPCTVSSGCRGWIRWKPGRAATVSAIFGLCFIVHDPSG